MSSGNGSPFTEWPGCASVQNLPLCNTYWFSQELNDTSYYVARHEFCTPELQFLSSRAVARAFPQNAHISVPQRSLAEALLPRNQAAERVLVPIPKDGPPLSRNETSDPRSDYRLINGIQ